MASGQLHMIPYDGFAFANSKANDLCVRTLTNGQKILLSPAKTNPDTDNPTLTVGTEMVTISGHLSSTGRVKSSDVETLSIKLRKASSTQSSNVSSVPIEAHRYRIGVYDSVITTQLDTESYDVILIRDNVDPNIATQQPISFDIVNNPNINGRVLLVKNCRPGTAITVRVLSMDGTTITKTSNVAANAHVAFVGFLDQWN